MSRDRDRILEQALKHELRAAGTPADAHLDAETLAAWADDGLDGAAMASVETHLSNCARCQAMAATFARSSAPVAAGAPEPRGFPLWKWWLAPIAAGVTAVTLWMVIPEEQQQFTEQARPQAKDSRAAENLSTYIPQATEPPKAVAESRIEVDKLAAGAREDRQQNQAISEAKREEPERQLRDRAASADTEVPAAPSPAAPSAAAAAPAAVALEAPAAGADVGALQKSARLAAAAPAEIATFDPNRRWRVAGDRIERTVDGGKSWTLIHQEPGAGLTAGSAPSLLVCWFVGRAGTVLLTTDAGATFTRVDLAEPLDLASVAGVDARNAAIYSVSGRRFRTSDGGQTWLPF